MEKIDQVERELYKPDNDAPGYSDITLEEPENRTIKILHIEDSQTSQQLIRRNLHGRPTHSFMIQCANRLDAATVILSKSRFDAILLDMFLPDSWGLKSLKKVRVLARFTPIILLANHEDSDLVVQAMREGADNHICKSNLKPKVLEDSILTTIERKIVEQELVSDKERFEVAARGSSVGLWDVDVVTKKLFWSKRYKEILGIEDNEFVPHHTTFRSRLHPDDKDRVMKVMDSHLKNHSTYDIEYRLRHEKGHYLWIHSRGEAVWDDNGQPIRMAGSVDDITDNKKAESDKLTMELQLRHSQKLESVGQLAAGISQEINTSIQCVGDNLSFLKNSVKDLLGLISEYRKVEAALSTIPGQEPLLKKLEQYRDDIDFDYLIEEVAEANTHATDGVTRVTEIVRAIKEFSHPCMGEKVMSDINESIRNTLLLAKNEYKYTATVETNFSDIPQVPCLIGDIRQVLLNLVVNAAHAIEDARESDQDPMGLISISTRSDGEFVNITIKDSGCGVSDAIKDRIFDPFFTTKEVGRGSGQGLAIARNIVVTKHGGDLTLEESAVGKGATFILRLPIQEIKVEDYQQGDSLSGE